MLLGMWQAAAGTILGGRMELQGSVRPNTTGAGCWPQTTLSRLCLIARPGRTVTGTKPRKLDCSSGAGAKERAWGAYSMQPLEPHTFTPASFLCTYCCLAWCPARGKLSKNACGWKSCSILPARVRGPRESQGCVLLVCLAFQSSLRSAGARPVLAR